MNKLTALLFLCLLVSCQWFDEKAPDKDMLLQQRLNEIDWNGVSSYPSVAGCEGELDKEARKNCFFEAMARLVQEKLDADTIAVLYPEMDTINVKVTVYPDARILFESQFEPDSTSYDRKVIDSIIKNRLADFPPVEPAQKEGIPVTTQFILPVVINVHNTH